MPYPGFTFTPLSTIFGSTLKAEPSRPGELDPRHVKLGKSIARGLMGAVASGTYDGQPAIFKLLDESKKPGLVEELQNESDVYAKLVTLQGRLILEPPSPVSSGTTCWPKTRHESLHGCSTPAACCWVDSWGRAAAELLWIIDVARAKPVANSPGLSTAQVVEKTEDWFQADEQDLGG
ncbi:hypothetical protein M427DRAFT_43225 [Gonapodya prolifera JEL478]|uniref:Protein kinase domain-containing protein n=1 Tax=Gonapodya prolifera (strain JEL478) TaxID=1344416 RepID=A0A139AJD9_GONPJ|nr:hypothetical protein M427DRAFT_43225 [Gonapodya prolifera JEL478]|eukprot:KXS16916.1 hypothetical protein M427DRAFT_43225 [Gonapodya prolifera JEL478]